MAAEPVFVVNPQSKVFQGCLGFMLIVGLGLLVAWTVLAKPETYYQQPYVDQPKSPGLAASGVGNVHLNSRSVSNKILLSGISYPDSRQNVKRIPFETGRGV